MPYVVATSFSHCELSKRPVECYTNDSVLDNSFPWMTVRVSLPQVFGARKPFARTVRYWSRTLAVFAKTPQ